MNTISDAISDIDYFNFEKIAHPRPVRVPRRRGAKVALVGRRDARGRTARSVRTTAA